MGGVGKKMVVYGKAARWWDGEVKGLRREIYKKIIMVMRAYRRTIVSYGRRLESWFRKDKLDVWNVVQ